MGQPVAPAFAQTSFRARTNVTDPSGVDAAFDAGDAAADADWTQAVNELIRVRFLVQQTVSGAVNHDATTTEFLLQYENETQATGFLAAGAVGADVEHVQYIAATGFADHDDTTSSLIGAGTMVDGDGKEAAGATDSVVFTEEALTETELEFSIEIVGANVDDADVINLRLLYSNGDEAPPATPIEAYTETPTMTANASAPTATGIPVFGAMTAVSTANADVSAVGVPIFGAMTALGSATLQITLTITLKQGVTTIKSFTGQIVPDAVGTLDLSLSEAELATITYPASDLTIEIAGHVADQASIRVYALELVIPAQVGAPTATGIPVFGVMTVVGVAAASVAGVGVPIFAAMAATGDATSVAVSGRVMASLVAGGGLAGAGGIAGRGGGLAG